MQAIKEDWAPPQTFLEAEAKEAQAKDQAEKLAVREKAEQEAVARADRLEALSTSLSPEERDHFEQQAESKAREIMGNPKLPLLTGLVKAQLYTLLETKYRGFGDD